MSRFFIVVIGGGLGSGARYLVCTALAERLGVTFPWGTFTVNLLGSFLLGAIATLGLSSATMSVEVRLLLTTGFMGGFTTYSAFNYETLNLLLSERWIVGIANIGLTLVGCLLGGGLGVLAGRAAGA